MNAIDKTVSTGISLGHLLDVLAVAPDARTGCRTPDRVGLFAPIASSPSKISMPPSSVAPVEKPRSSRRSASRPCAWRHLRSIRH